MGPVGTFFISILLIFLFGASFFFTSVPRNAIEGFVDLADDPDGSPPTSSADSRRRAYYTRRRARPR